MVSARAFKMAPRKIAEAVTEHLVLDGTFFDRFEIAGPGFLNFFLSSRFYAGVLRDIQKLGGDYGRSDYGRGKKIMVEFVSANPTGPMHMGNARGGALGDCLAAVLDAAHAFQLETDHHKRTPPLPGQAAQKGGDAQ